MLGEEETFTCEHTGQKAKCDHLTVSANTTFVPWAWQRCMDWSVYWVSLTVLCDQRGGEDGAAGA